MPDWLIAIILGIVEGITEFIPVSSTGHLLVADHVLGLGKESFFRSDLFNIVIQCGAVLAVLPLFKDRLKMLTHFHDAESRLFLAKIAVAFGITGAVGFVIDKKGFKLPETLPPVAWALIIGGIVFIVVEKWLATRAREAVVSWPSALATAVGQLIAAVFPGSSRSGSTIMLSMISGTNRVAATEFSFLVGIPTMLAAGAWKIRKQLHHADPTAVPPDWAMLGLATVVAAIVSFIAVKWLLKFVQTHTFVGFGIYRIIFGIVILAVVFSGKAAGH
jgi:undecaprenyl-diphosphatase